MKVYEVLVNGQKVCAAGIEIGVMHCIVGSNDQENRLRLDVGGLNSATKMHERWKPVQLNVGDEVTIRILEGVAIDEPSERYPQRPPDS